MSNKVNNLRKCDIGFDNSNETPNERKLWVVIDEDSYAENAVEAGCIIHVYQNYDEAVEYFEQMVECAGNYDESHMCEFWSNRYTYMGNKPDGEKWFGVCSPDTSRYSYVNLLPLERMDDNWLIRICEKVRFNRTNRAKIREGSIVTKEYGYKRQYSYDDIVDGVKVTIPHNGEFDDNYHFFVEQLENKDLTTWVHNRPDSWIEVISDNSQQILGRNIELPISGNVYCCDFPDAEAMTEVTALLMTHLTRVLGKLGNSVRFFLYTDDLAFYFSTDAEFGVVATLAELIGDELWKPYDATGKNEKEAGQHA